MSAKDGVPPDSSQWRPAPGAVPPGSVHCLGFRNCRAIGNCGSARQRCGYVLLDKVDTLTDVSVSPNGLSHKTMHLCNTIVRRNLDKHLFGVLSSRYA